MTGPTRQLRIASAARLRSIRSVLRKRRDNQSAGSRSSATGSNECTYGRITHVEGLALLCSPTPRNESGLPGTRLLNSTRAGMLSSSTSTGATSRSRSGCPRGARWSSTSHRMPPRRATDHTRGRSLGTASERAAAACHKGPQRAGMRARANSLSYANRAGGHRDRRRRNERDRAQCEVTGITVLLSTAHRAG